MKLVIHKEDDALYLRLDLIMEFLKNTTVPRLQKNL
jgi:hypothetical protein